MFLHSDDHIKLRIDTYIFKVNGISIIATCR